MLIKLINQKDVLKLIYAIILIFLLACSSSEEINEEQSEDVLSNSHFNNEDKLFNVDDFVEAGWKKSKEFITDAKDDEGNFITPNATEIWYGFYKRKDIASHTASSLQIRKPIYTNAKSKNIPYKKFIQKYGEKYSWFK